MTCEYISRGHSLDYINAGDDLIAAGSPVALTNMVGVAGCDIAPNETGSVRVHGVFNMPNNDEEIDAFAEVYLIAATGKITTTAGGNVPAGIAVAAAKTTDKMVAVKLLG